MGTAALSGFGFVAHGQGAANIGNGREVKIWVSDGDCTLENFDNFRHLFKSENVPLGVWMLLAFGYRNNGYHDLFGSLLRDAEVYCNLEKAGDATFETPFLYAVMAVNELKLADVCHTDSNLRFTHRERAKEYLSRCQELDDYTRRIAMGVYHLSTFLKSKSYESKTKAKEMFSLAMQLKPWSLVPLVYYANILVLEGHFSAASVYYLHALVIANYLEILSKQPKNIKKNTASAETYFAAEDYPQYMLMDRNIKFIRALLYFGLAACKFALGHPREACDLVDKSLSINETPAALKLKASIAALFVVGDGLNNKGGYLKTWFESSLAAFHKGTSNSNSNGNSNNYHKNPGSISISCPVFILNLAFEKQSLNKCEWLMEYISKSESPALLAHVNFIYGKQYHNKLDANNEDEESGSRSLDYYKKAISYKSDFAAARLNLIKVAVILKRLTVAREHADHLIAQTENMIHNSEIQRLCSLVYLLLAKQSLDRARLELISSEHQKNNAAVIDVSCLYFSVVADLGRLIDERIFKAYRLISDAIDALPQDPFALEFQCKCLELLIERGRESYYPKLFESYQRLFALYQQEPKNAWKNNFAVVCLKVHDFKRAIGLLEGLTAKLQNRSNCNSASSVCINDAGQPVDADADLFTGAAAALPSDPSYLIATFNLAYAKEFNGNLNSAQRIYSQLTRDYPKYAPPWLRKSIISFNKGDLSNAKRYLDELKQQNRQSVEPWLMRAHMLISNGQYADGIAEIHKLTQVIKSASFDPYTNTLLASAVIQKYVSNGNAGSHLPKEVMSHAKMGLRRPALSNFYAANCIAVILAHARQMKAAYECFGFLLENQSLNSHMRLIASKNMAIFCASTASKPGTADSSGHDKIKLTKAQQNFQIALQSGKMDKPLYVAYSRFLYDTQKYRLGFLILENARLVYPTDVTIVYNQLVILDTMLCKALKDPNLVRSLVEMTSFLCAANHLNSVASQLHRHVESSGGNRVIPLANLEQIAARAKEKILPHLVSALPKLLENYKESQLAKERRLELQRTILKAQEEKRLQQEQQQKQTLEAEKELSERLLQEASEIASELLLSRTVPPQTNANASAAGANVSSSSVGTNAGKSKEKDKTREKDKDKGNKGNSDINKR